MVGDMLPFEQSLPVPLPKALLNLVYCFDPTRRENYDKVIKEINNYHTNAKYILEHDSTLMDGWYAIGSSNWYWYWKRPGWNNPYHILYWAPPPSLANLCPRL